MTTLPPIPIAHGTRVRLQRIGRVFDTGVVALDGIDIDAAPGEFLAILGPSGCGKSTLLRLIAGLDQPQHGTVHIDADASAGPSLETPTPPLPGDSITRGTGGPPVSSDSRYGRAAHATISGADRRANIAYVFQDAHLLPWRTVLDNVALPLELMGVARSDWLEAAGHATEQVGLGEAAGRYPNQLSGGQRMRVSLARAIVTQPRLLLLDEPFAALDEITRQRLDEQLRQLWSSRAMTVLFVTHSTTEAVFLAQRAVVMTKRPGRIIADHRIDLPMGRPGAIRATAEFARETRVLYDALERGEA